MFRHKNRGIELSALPELYRQIGGLEPSFGETTSGGKQKVEDKPDVDQNQKSELKTQLNDWSGGRTIVSRGGRGSRQVQ